MSAFTAGTREEQEALERLLGELRPKLHRYCARMTGSAIDGEDVAVRDDGGRDRSQRLRW